MRRREFLSALGSAAVLTPFNLHAQQAGKIYRVAVFATVDNPAMTSAYRAFIDEMRAQGFVEGQNLTLIQQPTNRPSATLAANVADAMRSGVDVIVTSTQPALQAAAGTGVPVVISANNYDPIAHGYVKSLAQPGGNVTGVFLRQTELAEKQVELLTQAFPARKQTAMLWDTISGDQFVAAERRAKSLGLDVIPMKFEAPPYDFAAAFSKAVQGGAQQALCLSSPFLGRYAQDIVDQAARHRLPTMFIFRAYTELGGLMSYGVDPRATYSQLAGYVTKILRGAKPADLPVEQPNKFELVVNLKTAKAIGVELPTAILLRADQVIE